MELVWEDGPLRDADPRTHGILLQILEGAGGVDGERPRRITRVSETERSAARPIE